MCLELRERHDRFAEFSATGDATYRKPAPKGIHAIGGLPGRH